MTKIKIYIAIAFILICVLYLVSIFEIKDQYDKELSDLRKENTKLEIDNKQHIGTIEDLLDQVHGKKAIECDCEEQYKWLQDFYDEFHEQVGAYE